MSSKLGFTASARGRVIRKNPQPAETAPLEPAERPVERADRLVPAAGRPLAPRRRRGRAAAREAAAESVSFASAVERRRNTPATRATSRIAPGELDEPLTAAARATGAAKRGQATSTAGGTAQAAPRQPQVARRGDTRPRPVSPPTPPASGGVLGKGGEDVEDMGGRQ